MRTHITSGVITPYRWNFPPGSVNVDQVSGIQWPADGMCSKDIVDSIKFRPIVYLPTDSESTDRFRIKKGKHLVRFTYEGASDPITQAELKDKFIYVRAQVVCRQRSEPNMHPDPEAPREQLMQNPSIPVWLSRILSNFTDCTSPIVRDRDAITDQCGNYLVYDKIIVLKQAKNYCTTWEFETYPSFDTGYNAGAPIDGESSCDRYYELVLSAIGQPDEVLVSTDTTSPRLQKILTAPISIQVSSTWYCNMISGPVTATVPGPLWRPMGTDAAPNIVMTSH